MLKLNSGSILDYMDHVDLQTSYSLTLPPTIIPCSVCGHLMMSDDLWLVDSGLDQICLPCCMWYQSHFGLVCSCMD